MSYFDPDAVRAAFAQPDCKGEYTGELKEYLAELGGTRPNIVLAFAPKVGGTFIRTAAIQACGGQLVRTVYSLGGRDGSFYLPAWLNYFAHGFPSRTLVTHVHLQALPANRFIMEALKLRPIVMLRSIPDALVSYADMLEQQCHDPDTWLNTRMPRNYATLEHVQKADFLVDMIGPWYASYFSSWAEYQEVSGSVLLLDYDCFRIDPMTTLTDILRHSGVNHSPAQTEQAFRDTWQARGDWRFRYGITGRGREFFNSEQLSRIQRQVDYYPVLNTWRSKLLNLHLPSAEAAYPRRTA